MTTPAATPIARLAGHVLADQLLLHGVDTVFGVPGESYLAVLDGLYRLRDQIRFVVNRQEGGAAFMADGWAKITGRPGVLMVTRGPGATNASIGIHSAMQDSRPMVVFVGQVGNEFAEREAFQEIDYRRMFAPVAKWVAQIDRPERIPELVARAFTTATSGRPGPVVLALPEDMLAATVTVGDARPHVTVRPCASAAQIRELGDMLAAARRPLLLLGGAGWSAEACGHIRRFAQANRLPVACAFRFQDVYDNRLDEYVGEVGIGVNPKLAARVRDADLLLVIGPRLGEMTTSGYTLLEAPLPRQVLVHVHAATDELGRVYQPTLAINAGMPEIAAMLADLRLDPAVTAGWADSVASARAEYLAWQQSPPIYAAGATPAIDLWQVVQILARVCPADTVIANGAGNFATWANRFWRYTVPGTQLAPTSGAMGYGVPAAIGARLADPTREVIVFTGDGDFLMTGQELATAVQYEAGLVILLFNNGQYGTIRMHQEREFPGRPHASALANPDFALLAQAFGGWGRRVHTTAEFEPALAEARAFAAKARRPALIELVTDPQAITPNLTLEQIRSQAEARGR